MVLSVSDSTIKVYNAALVRLGVPKIESFTDESISARTGSEMFEDVLESALCMYPWRFAMRRATLNRLGDTPPAPWEGLYDIPTEIRHVWKVYEDDYPSQNYEVYERRVAVNVTAAQTTAISVDGTAMIGPSSWPGYFRLPFITYLASQIAMPITQDERLAMALLDMGTTMLAKAASRDSQSRTPSRVDTKMFIRDRRKRGNAKRA